MMIIFYQVTFLFSFFILTLFSPLKGSSNEKQTALIFENILQEAVDNPSKLIYFFSQMPKGGDLHHHYAGSIYAETYLKWAKKDHQNIDNESYSIKNETDRHSISIEKIFDNPKLFDEILARWSFKNEIISQKRNQFFARKFFHIFSYFSEVKPHKREGFLLLKKRAINENVLYIETMLSAIKYPYNDSLFNKKVHQIKEKQKLFTFLDHTYNLITSNPIFIKSVTSFVKDITVIHNTEKIDGPFFKMRYQTYAHRNQSPSQVFASLCSAFWAAQQSPLIVGVNILGAEHHRIALKDYDLHMTFFQYLKGLFPEVHVSIHAGELTTKITQKDHLSNHITKAIQVGLAERIGHGVDLPHEKEALRLLIQKKPKVSVELNFISNKIILGIFPNEHPYPLYRSANIPIVICTDDSGVFRQQLEDQYLLLAQAYRPSYLEIKTYVYNSISYSFLNAEEKNNLLRILNQQFDIFEKHCVQLFAKNMENFQERDHHQEIAKADQQ